MAGPSSRRPSVAAGPSTLPLPPPSPRDPLQPQPRGCNNNARPTPPPPLTQPTTVKLSPAGLRMFLHRITHPPSPPPSLDGHATKKGKERAKWWSGWSLAIQPEYDVKLEDVLDRKHLPPLGLKDFEEWLVYVEGTPENLYFILWLREYEHRYDAWKSSLRSKHDLTLRNTSSHPSPITTSLNPPSVVVSSQRERAFASLGMAMSSLSLSPPSPHRSPAPYPSYPTFSSPRSPNPNVPPQVDDDIPDVELSRRRSIGYRTLYTPTPNAELATFYLRAKETFLTPAAEYELVDVSSDVLSIFHVPSTTSDRKARRDSGIAFQSTSEWDRERAAGEKLSRYGSRTTRDEGIAGGLVPVHSERLGLAGSNANAYPPDPAVFDELAEIVKDRLRASLRRLVFATYNNVGMPRAYCGSAGGCMIALVTSAPPIIASFAAGGPRWWRLLALPGLWLGMTIFISAMYGVCMMIYVFGDLRQLRSFELARPPPGADYSSNPKAVANPNINNANTKTKSVESHAPSPLSVVPPSPVSPERRSSVFTLRHGMMSRHNKSEDRLSPGALSHRSQADLPFRKDSLVPVPNPFPLLPMPSRPRPAYTIGGTSVRSKSRTPPESPIEEGATRGGSGSPREKPQLRLDIWGSGMGEGGSGVQVPPRAVTRERVGEEVGPTVVISSEDEGSVGEHSQYDDEYEDDEDEDGESDGYADDSGFEDTELDEDYEEDSSPYAFNSSRGGHRHRHRRRHTRPPPIEISGPYYDTDPSPEGPATAPADFMPYNLERLAARNPIPDVSTAHSDNPLWPDYSYQAQQREEEYERRKQETATFIGGFAYDGGESVSEWGRHSVSVESPHGDKDKDKEEKSVYAYVDAGEVEKGKGKGKGRMSAEEEVRQAQASQRMGPFDFDELPVRKMKPSLRVDVPVPVKGSATTSESPVVQETSRGTAAMSISGGGIGGVGQGGVDVRKMKEEKAERLREQRRLEANTKGSVRSTSSRRSPSPGSSVSTSSNGKPQRWYWVFVEWMQVKCGPKNILDVIDEREREGKEEGGKGKGKSRLGAGAGVSPARAVMEQARVHAERQSVPPASSPVCSSVGVVGEVATATEEREARRRARPSWRERLRKVYLAVPAFAAPLTPVLNPLVGRAQWEIVVRSAAASAVLSCVIVGGLLGAPET